jgi:hypothetical protein
MQNRLPLIVDHLDRGYPVAGQNQRPFCRNRGGWSNWQLLNALLLAR